MELSWHQITEIQTRIFKNAKDFCKMKKIIFKVSFLLLFMLSGTYSIAQDWANRDRYTPENTNLGEPASGENRVVFMGNSIIEAWSQFNPEFFTGKPYINRGISGQTTPQMLVRFRSDVLNLKPAVVVILGGTNDIAGNNGPTTLNMIMDNIISMAELAKANNIKVVLASVLPTLDYPWRPGLNPADKIAALNELIKEYARRSGIVYLDYYSAMVDNQRGLKTEYSYDGVHPNAAGYKVMAPLTEDAIAKALKQK